MSHLFRIAWWAAGACVDLPLPDAWCIWISMRCCEVATWAWRHDPDMDVDGAEWWRLFGDKR